MDQNNQNLTDATNKQVANSLDENIQQVSSNIEPTQTTTVGRIQKPKPGTGFIILISTMLALSILTVILPLIGYLSIINQVNNGNPDGALAGIIIIPLLFIGYIVSFFNFVIGLFYLNKYQLTTKSTIIAVLVVAFSLCYILIPLINSI